MILKRLCLGNGIAFLVTFFTFATPANTHNDGVRMGFIAGMNSKYFLLDQNGKVLKELDCIFAQPFSEGLALIRKRSPLNPPGSQIGFPFGDEKSAFIDASGNEIKMPDFQRANPFSEGITWADTGRGGNFLMDKTGKIIAKVSEDWVVDTFSEGMAPVLLEREEMRGMATDPALLSNRWGFIDTAGKLVIPFGLSYANPFHQGVASVRDKKGQWLLIDKTGKQLGEKQDDVDTVSDGMAKFKAGTKYGYLNNLGTPVIQAKYSEARDFAEGLAAVKVGDKFGFIDKSGNEKIVPQFLDSLKFQDGLCPVQTAEKKWGFIDQTGKLVIQATFDEALPFSDERALVQAGESIAFIDKAGKFIVQPKYDTASSFRNKRTIVSLGSPEERKKTIARLAEWKKRVEEAKQRAHSPEAAAAKPQLSFIELSNEKGTESTMPRGISPDGKYYLDKVSFYISRNGKSTAKLILIRKIDEERLQEYTADFEAAPAKNDHMNSTSIEDFSWAPDSKNFVYAASDNLFFCNVEKNERINWADRHLKSYNLCRYSPDGRFIAVGGAQGDKWNSTPELMILDAKTKEILFHPDIYSAACIAWSPDSSKIAVRFGPQCLKILDAKNNFVPLTLIQKEFGQIAFSPDAKYIASSRFNQIDIFDTKGNLIEKHPLNQVVNITWTPNSKEIFYTTDILRNLSTQTLKLSLQPPSSSPSSKVPSGEAADFVTTLPKYGVIDSKGKVIIPFKYFSLKRRADGKFEAGLFDKKNTFLSPASYEILDKTGTVEKFTSPKGLLIIRPVGNLIIVKKDEIVYPELAGEDIFGAIDLHEKIVIEPNYKAVPFADENMILLTNRNGVTEIFNNAGVKTGSLPQDVHIFERPYGSGNVRLQNGLIPVESRNIQTRGFYNSKGELVGKMSQDAEYYNNGSQSKAKLNLEDKTVLPDGLEIKSRPSNVNFSPLDWRSESKTGRTNKRKLFNGFLKDNDVIGMSKDKMIALLGTPSHPNDSNEKNFLAYTLEATGCINEHVWFAVKFENDKVKAWRVSQGIHGSKDNWNTTNMVYENDLLKPKYGN